MAEPKAHSSAPEARVDAIGGLEPVVLGSVRAPARASLDGARSHLAAAVDALDGWYARYADSSAPRTRSIQESRFSSTRA